MLFKEIKPGSVLEYEGNILLMYIGNRLYDAAGNIVTMVGYKNGKVHFMRALEFGYSIDYSNFIAVYNSFDKSKCLWRKRIVLSDFEYSLLEHFSKKYKYIARDENGDLNLYTKEPEKGSKEFFDICDDGCYGFYEFNDYFKMILWEDEQASLICDILNDYS